MELRDLDQSALMEAARVLGTLLQPGHVVLLVGPMGAGKTTFTRALAQGLDVRRPDRVRSPTYNLCLLHPGPRPLAHVDLFRLADEGQDDLGPVAAAFESLDLSAPTGAGSPDEAVLVVEWADLWAEPPADSLRITIGLESVENGRRTLLVAASGPNAESVRSRWQAALSG